MVHTMRCCPPAGQSQALTKFDQLVQTCFSAFTGLRLESGQWEQATRGLSHAGLGLRSTRQHAAGAYLSSVGGCARLCGDLDSGFWVDHSGDIAAALSELNAALPPSQQLGAAAALAQSQKQFSDLMDEAGCASQKASLVSEAAPGARAFLTCVPSGRTKMEPAVFVSEVRVRLGVPEANHDAWCPKCDAVLDAHGHHSGMCMAGGERVLRHNALRGLVYSWAERACLRPEKERAGLLLPQRPDDTSSARRRPADVFLPSFLGRPTALDFAVTAPQRLDALGARGGCAAAVAYADGGIWTRVRLSKCPFCQWWSKQLGLGPLRLRRHWGKLLPALRRAMRPTLLLPPCCSRPASWCAHGGPGRPCAVGPRWPHRSSLVFIGFEH